MNDPLVDYIILGFLAAGCIWGIIMLIVIF